MKAIFYDWGGANAWLFYLINGFHSPWWDRFMLAGTALSAHSNFPLYVATVALAGVIATGLRKKPRPREASLGWLSAVCVFAWSYVVVGLLVAALKAGLDLPRPPLALPPGSVHIVGAPEYRHSFPSGHSAFAMTVAASLWPVLRRGWKILAVLFVAWVGLSRVSLGVHFPADVVGSYALALLTVVAVRFLVTRLSATLGGKMANP